MQSETPKTATATAPAIMTVPNVVFQRSDDECELTVSAMAVIRAAAASEMANIARTPPGLVEAPARTLFSRS